MTELLEGMVERAQRQIKQERVGLMTERCSTRNTQSAHKIAATIERLRNGRAVSFSSTALEWLYRSDGYMFDGNACVARI